MTARRTAIVLAASLGLLPRPAFAQAAEAPAAAQDAGHGARHDASRVASREAKPRKAHPRKLVEAPARPVSRTATSPAPAAAAPSIPGRESEAASLERRRRAFFATEPDAATPGPEAPSAGVTLGGSGGLSPGMGFRF